MSFPPLIDYAAIVVLFNQQQQSNIKIRGHQNQKSRVVEYLFNVG